MQTDAGGGEAQNGRPLSKPIRCVNASLKVEPWFQFVFKFPAHL